MAVGNRVCGAGFYAVAAEDAAGVVNVVDLCVAFPCRDAIGRGIFSRLNINTIRWACGGAKKAADALFVAVLVALKYVYAPVARLDAGRGVGKALRRGLAEHGAQRHAETFVQRNEGFADFLDDGCHLLSTLAELVEAGKRACDATLPLVTCDACFMELE